MGMQEIWEFLVSLWMVPEVKYIVSHTLINTVLGVAAAVHQGTFKLNRVGEFLWKKMLPYIAVYGIARVFGDGAGLGWLAPAALTVIGVTLIADLAESLSMLGIKIPSFIEGLVSKES